MGRLADKLANEMLDENMNKGTAQMLWCAHTGLEHWRNRLLMKLFGHEAVTDRLTNYLWDEWLQYCGDEVRPTKFELRKLSRKIVNNFEWRIREKWSIREFLLDAAASVMRFVYRLPKPADPK